MTEMFKDKNGKIRSGGIGNLRGAKDCSRSSPIELNYRLSKFDEPAKVWLALPPDLPSQKVKIRSVIPKPASVIPT